MKRILSLVLTVTLHPFGSSLFAPFYAAAAAEHVFVLPAALQEIEEQAFCREHQHYNAGGSKRGHVYWVRSIRRMHWADGSFYCQQKNVRIANDAFKTLP